jgi:hypothetical protein
LEVAPALAVYTDNLFSDTTMTRQEEIMAEVEKAVKFAKDHLRLPDMITVASDQVRFYGLAFVVVERTMPIKGTPLAGLFELRSCVVHSTEVSEGEFDEYLETKTFLSETKAGGMDSEIHRHVFDAILAMQKDNLFGGWQSVKTFENMKKQAEEVF